MAAHHGSTAWQHSMAAQHGSTTTTTWRTQHGDQKGSTTWRTHHGEHDMAAQKAAQLLSLNTLRSIERSCGGVTRLGTETTTLKEKRCKEIRNMVCAKGGRTVQGRTTRPPDSPPALPVRRLGSFCTRAMARRGWWAQTAGTFNHDVAHPYQRGALAHGN